MTPSRFALCMILCAACCLPAAAQTAKKAQPAPAPKFVANTDEARVGAYTLPDPLKMNDGTPVTTAEQWTAKRRPELLKMFMEEEYGRPPRAVTDLKFQVTAVKKDALGGKATRKLVHLWLANHPAWGGMDLLLYIPNGAAKPAPAFLGLNFNGNHAVSTEKDVPPPAGWMAFNSQATPDPESARGKEVGRWPLEEIVARGYAVGTIWYGSIEPDQPGAWQRGVRGALAKDGPDAGWDAEKDWSAIGAWAWGLSRALDYLETDQDVDAKKVAVIGHSRLGKTSAWAGASDERFAMIISNDSGEGGVALARRNYGETLESMLTPFPHWFCAKHWSYVGRVGEMPIDQHELVALGAPRPYYIASAQGDQWADPKGEFLGGKGAEPVYKLFGKAGLGVEEWPAVDHPVGVTIGYHMRTGPHDITVYDWEQYLKFADRHFGKK